MSLAPGDLVEGRFRLEAPIGEGGTGIVWSAVRLADETPVALKIIKARNSDTIRRVLREGRIAQRLAHPGIVRVDELLTPADGPPIIVMELLSGESLRERLVRERSLGITETARIIGAVTNAAAAAHAAGIVHRDLKPENIFLERTANGESRVKVLDFGLAKVAVPSELHTAGMTQSGSILGTPLYMAPEQVFGEGDVDARADVWAIGVLLFECLAGKRPFSGENYGQIFKAITMGTAPALSEVRPDVSAELSALVASTLESDRDRRPSTDTIISLLRHHAGTPIVQVSTESTDPFAATIMVDATDAHKARVENIPRPRARRRWLGGVAIAGLVLSTGLGVLRANATGTREHVSSPVPLETVERDNEKREDAAAPPSASISILASSVAVPAPTIELRPNAPVVVRPTVPAPPTRSVASTSPSSAEEPKQPTARLPGGVHGDNPY